MCRVSLLFAIKFGIDPDLCDSQACCLDPFPVLLHTCQAAGALSKLIFIIAWKVTDILLKNIFYIIDVAKKCYRVVVFLGIKNNAEENWAEHKAGGVLLKAQFFFSRLIEKRNMVIYMNVEGIHQRTLLKNI